MSGSFQRSDQAQRLDAIEGRMDPWLLLIFAVLAAFGLVMVASSSVAVAEGFKVGETYFVARHAFFLLAGAGLAAVLVRTELRWIEQRSQWLLIACFVLLGAVYLPGLGYSVNGARRWINVGVSNFQVVEAVKLLLIVWLASYLKRYYSELQQSWRAMLKPIGVLIAMVVFLLMQPDFGSAMLLCSVVGGMLILGGVSLPRLLAPVLIGLPMLAMVAISESYRIRRLTSFLDPWADPFKDGFQLTQALIAIGRGEWFGVGLGASVQKLFYLPEAHTDFILAVIAEELGFAGVMLVIALYAGFAGRAFWIGLRAIELRRLFSAYCAFGVALWIGLQALVSIGVNLGVLPTKGLTLPLISSGGSSVLMTCAAIGLLLRVSLELDRAERKVARVRADLADEAEFSPITIPGKALSRRRREPTLGAAA
ncbi:MAG: putative lipid II flippase FtsW [Gammaproteobacteria bacterium HGW-Gammaproteobacteria-4]|jgi:cell division protein FtsW|nr:MAG: putative lipid II flippase FtsW [Gammaproteobacteria bacterium HGW-Gammaproteobacteria-4]